MMIRRFHTHYLAGYLLLWPIIALCSDELRSVHSGANYYSAVVSVNPATFSPERAMAVASLVRDRHRDFALTRVYVVPDGCDAPIERSYIMDGRTYDGWQRSFQMPRTFCPTARILFCHHGEVLDYVDATRSFHRVLNMPDPTVLNLPALHAELRYLLIHSLSAIKQDQDRAEVFVAVDGTITQEVAATIFKTVQDMMPLSNITTYIRNDSWFISIPSFPLRDVFQHEDPPTLDQYERTPTAICRAGMYARASDPCSIIHSGE
jgi:hypothetical protein